MGKRISEVLGYIAAVGLVVLAGWAVIRGVQEEPAIVGSLATAAGAIVAVVVGQNRAQRAQLQEAHRKQMTPLYEEFLGKLQNASEDPDNPEVPELVEFLREFKFKLLLRGPPDVVQAVNNFERAATAVTQDNLEDPTALIAYENLIRAIRADFGHNDSNLKQGDILRLFVSDIDEYLPRK